MKADIILLLVKIQWKNPFKDGHCIYCGGSENSNHYPDCIYTQAGKIIQKYNISTELPDEMKKEYSIGAEFEAETPVDSLLPKVKKQTSTKKAKDEDA